MRYDAVSNAALVRTLDVLATTAQTDEVLIDRELLAEVTTRYEKCLNGESTEPEADPRQLPLI